MAYYGGMQGAQPWGKYSERMIFIGMLLIAAILLIMLGIGSLQGPELPIQAVPVVAEKVVPVEAEPVVLPTRKYLVPKQTIWPGQKIQKKMLALSKETASAQLAERYSLQFSEVVGKYATAVLVEGAPVLKEHIANSLNTESFISKIPEGFRAVTIPVDTESAVEGWVQPGVNVDVVWSSSREGKQFITTIVEKSLVLSTNGGMAQVVEEEENSGKGKVKAKKNPNFVTLLLSVENAQRVQLAKQTKGTLSLNLRGQGDEAVVGSALVSVDRLIRSSQVEKLDRVEGVILDGVPHALQGGKLVPIDEDETGVEVSAQGSDTEKK